MQEAVRAEVIKLLDAGIIYPIFYSKWVSSIHVVPKRVRLMVVKNRIMSWCQLVFSQDGEFVSTTVS
jgi:hypothetical protein